MFSLVQTDLKLETTELQCRYSNNILCNTKAKIHGMYVSFLFRHGRIGTADDMKMKIRAVVSGLIIDTSPDQTAPHIGKT